MRPNYSINQHAHRFSAWAASRAASTSPVCRFEVNHGVKALESCGFDENFTLEDLPNPAKVDAVHSAWRKSIRLSKPLRDKNPSDGVAAKLINTYLKARFVCGGYHDNDSVKALHPPIDSILLKGLSEKANGEAKNPWKKYLKVGWSNFSKKEYEEVIQLIKETLDGDPLWMIEEHWPGFR